jgi:hypothetical protein
VSPIHGVYEIMKSEERVSKKKLPTVTVTAVPNAKNMVLQVTALLV